MLPEFTFHEINNENTPIEYDNLDDTSYKLGRQDGYELGMSDSNKRYKEGYNDAIEDLKYAFEEAFKKLSSERLPLHYDNC